MNIEDLEDIIRILIDMLINNNVSKEEITLKLREYHYCFDCCNHYRHCKCEESSSSILDDNYESSIYSDNSDNLE